MQNARTQRRLWNAPTHECPKVAQLKVDVQLLGPQQVGCVIVHTSIKPLGDVWFRLVPVPSIEGGLVGLEPTPTKIARTLPERIFTRFTKENTAI